MSIINEALDSIQQRIADYFNGFLELAYLGGWYAVAAATVAACVFLVMFFPFKYLRMGAGIVVVAWAIFLAGMQIMFNHMRGDTQVYRDKVRKLEQQQETKKGDGWFS